MQRSLPIYSSTATRRERGRGWSSRRRRRRLWRRAMPPALLGGVVAAAVTLAARALGSL